MLWVEDKTFLNEDVKLDYTRWKNCKFIGCEIIVKYGEYDLVGCGFTKCKLSLGASAFNILKICSLFYPTIPTGKDVVKTQEWVETALNWIHKKNPEALKKWVYGTMLEAEELNKKERVIVAPRGSKYESKAGYLTNGVADGVEINAALEWARAAEGEVLLIHASYDLEKPINDVGFTREEHPEGTLFKFKGKKSVNENKQKEEAE